VSEERPSRPSRAFPPPTIQGTANHPPGKRSQPSETSTSGEKEPTIRNETRAQEILGKEEESGAGKRGARAGKRTEREKPTIPEQANHPERKTLGIQKARRERDPGEREPEPERREAQRARKRETPTIPGKSQPSTEKEKAKHPKKKKESQASREKEKKGKTERARSFFFRLANREMKKRSTRGGQKTKPEKRKLTDWFCSFFLHRCISCNRTEFHPFYFSWEPFFLFFVFFSR